MVSSLLILLGNFRGKLLSKFLGLVLFGVLTLSLKLALLPGWQSTVDLILGTCVLLGYPNRLIVFFCHNHYEDHNHLFFHCPFSDKVWSKLKTMINLSWPILLWPELVEHVSKTV